MFWATLIVGALFLGWIYNTAVFGNRYGTKNFDYQMNFGLMILSGLLLATLIVIQLV